MSFLLKAWSAHRKLIKGTFIIPLYTEIWTLSSVVLFDDLGRCKGRGG